MILVVGYKGNMGKRYTSILDYLGKSWTGVDYGDDWPEEEFKGVLIATPTSNHLDDIYKASKYNCPILCEKPICIGIPEVEYVKDRLTMVNQYAYLHRKGNEGRTYYNYFKTGSDGLAWDCINIVGLAKSTVILSNNSPYWFCIINDFILDISKMDDAYIAMVSDWLAHKLPNYDYLMEAHKKVLAYEAH